MSHVQRQPIMQFLEVPLTAWDQCSRIYGQTGALESPKSVGTFLMIHDIDIYFQIAIQNSNDL